MAEVEPDVADGAEHDLRVLSAQWRADELTAFYLRLVEARGRGGKRMPPAVAYDVLFAEFFPSGCFCGE